MKKEIITENAEVLIEGKDFIYLDLKEGQELNVKVEGAERFVSHDYSELFVRMKSSANPVIYSPDSNLFHLLNDYMEREKKQPPFFCRIVGGTVVNFKNSSKDARAIKSYQNFTILSL